MKSKPQINDYLRTTDFPTIWCPGCGHGIILKAAIRAIAELELDKNDVMAVSGIGCSARTPAYGDFNSIQTTHGRALAFATGIKIQRPDKHVILFLGDGDCTAIGGNHFIHAARRNINLTVIIMNNYIYGMTGGQVSPTTPTDSYSSTTPYGNLEPAMDVCNLAVAAGASYVARTTVYHVNQLKDMIVKGIAHNGFSVIECLDACPTNYGRKNNLREPKKMYEWLKESSVSVEQAKTMTEQELAGKNVIGIFKDVNKAEYTDQLFKMTEHAKTTQKKDFNLLEVTMDETVQPLDKLEFRLTGSGGQGLILAGIMLAEATIMNGKNAVHAQSYGPEARGGASRSEVIVSDYEIDFPEVHTPDVLLAMTQQSCDKFVSTVKENGVILVDSTLVDTVPQVKAKVVKLPITQIAIEEFKTELVANVIAVGALAKLTGIIPIELLEKAVAARVPSKSKDKNIQALHRGYDSVTKI
jgi:2-oxoglutarate ferredoxin oxidoreductase subunit beta